MAGALRNIIKTGLLFATVGVALAVAAPYLAAVAGIETASIGTMANPAWLGAFFGGMGVLDGMMRPVFDKIFDNKKPMAGEKPAATQGQQAPAPTISPVLEQAGEKQGQLYSQKILDERAHHNHHYANAR